MKLHLGCGSKYIEGFIHVDARPHEHVDYIASADNLSMFGDGSADLIYSCHLLEHFKRGKVQEVLKEWFRVLKPGGVLRVCVPDFSKLVKLYNEKKDLSVIMGPLYGRQDYEYNIHYVTFDFETLKSHLEQAGFSEVRTYDWRQTEHSHVDDYSQSYIPHMDKEKGELISLNVEAVKKAGGEHAEGQ